MTPGERNELKVKIEERMSDARSEIEELQELTKPIAPENAIGRVSRMDAINNKSVNEAALRQTEAKLQKLERALEKINEPNFGLCLKCGNNINPMRLMLMPESTHCINCADQ